MTLEGETDAAWCRSLPGSRRIQTGRTSKLVDGLSNSCRPRQGQGGSRIIQVARLMIAHIHLEGFRRRMRDLRRLGDASHIWLPYVFKHRAWTLPARLRFEFCEAYFYC